MPVLSAMLLLEFLVLLLLFRLSIFKNALSLQFSPDFIHFLNFKVLLMIMYKKKRMDIILKNVIWTHEVKTATFLPMKNDEFNVI